MSNIIAGPYELNNKTDSKDKITICILNDFKVSVRHYKGLKLLST
jgi:hypothetical protein